MRADLKHHPLFMEGVKRLFHVGVNIDGSGELATILLVIEAPPR